MLRRLTCIICPNGCEIELDVENGEVVALRGATCPRGERYARQEIANPMRTIASTVLVAGGTAPTVSVRLDAPVAKAQIPRVMEAIRAARLEAPVRVGDLVIANVAGLKSNVIATGEAERAPR